MVGFPYSDWETYQNIFGNFLYIHVCLTVCLIPSLSVFMSVTVTAEPPDLPRRRR